MGSFASVGWLLIIGRPVAEGAALPGPFISSILVGFAIAVILLDAFDKPYQP